MSLNIHCIIKLFVLLSLLDPCSLVVVKYFISSEFHNEVNYLYANTQLRAIVTCFPQSFE